MPPLLLLPWLIFGIWFAVAQSRFYAAHVERYGGPDRRERSRMFWTQPLDYLRLLRKPPYNWRAIFRHVDDPVVERRRQLYVLAAVAAFGYLPLLCIGFILYGSLFVW